MPHAIKTATGWFVIRVDDRRIGTPPAFATVKEDIRNTLLREGITAIAQASLSEVNVHAFDISGKEVKAEVEGQQ